jgi:hypothetical protein
MKRVLVSIIIVFFTSNLAWSSCTLTLRSFGAKGDGVTNDLAAINKALSLAGNPNKCELTGENLKYIVKGSIKNAGLTSVVLSYGSFYQLDTAEDIKTFYLTNAKVQLRKIIVNRGNHTRAGSYPYSAGIWVENSSNVYMRDVTVTGDGYGAGIKVVLSTNVYLLRLNVVNMRWSTPSPPTGEQIIGIWIVRSSEVKLENPTVKNLTGESGKGYYEALQTDGINFSGTKNVNVSYAYIENTGEGIDFTGSRGNSDFVVQDSTIVNADSWAFKFANSAVRGLIKDSKAIGAGYGGFVASGPSSPDLALKTSDITFLRCSAVDTGKNPYNRWNKNSTAGFWVMQSQYDLDYPKRIRIIDSASTGSSDKVTKYGIYSQLPQVGFYNFQTSANTIAATSGAVQSAYGYNFINSESQRILGCVFSPKRQDWFYDQSYTASPFWTSARLTADFVDLQRRGIPCN